MDALSVNSEYFYPKNIQTSPAMPYRFQLLQFVLAVNKCFKLAIKQPVLDILHGSENSKCTKKKALTACYCCN